jgi:hypothetical protein
MRPVEFQSRRSSSSRQAADEVGSQAHFADPRTQRGIDSLDFVGGAKLYTTAFSFPQLFSELLVWAARVGSLRFSTVLAIHCDIHLFFHPPKVPRLAAH